MHIAITPPSVIDAVPQNDSDNPPYELQFYKGRKYVQTFVATTVSTSGGVLDRVILVVDQHGHISIQSLKESITPAGDLSENE